MKKKVSRVSQNRKATYPAATRMADLMLILSTSWSPVSLQQICFDLGISPRTAKRYKKALNDYFRDKMGYEKGEDFTLVHSAKDDGMEVWMLSLKNELEAKAFQRLLSVYVSMVVLKSIGAEVLQDGIRALWQQTSGQVGSQDRWKLIHFDRKFRCSGFGRKGYADKDEVLESIITALINQNKVQLTYHSRNRKNPATHVIHPYTLLLHRDALYLHAFTEGRKQIRTFSIDRIVGARRKRERFSYPEPYDPDRLTDGSFGIFEARDEPPFPVSILFKERLREYITSRDWHPAQRFSKTTDGYFKMEAVITNTHEFIPWVLQFGSDATVLEPDAVCEKIKKELSKNIANYEKTTARR